MEFLTGKTADLHPAVVTGLAEYRHRVFVEQLGWQLNCKEGLELDEFDHEGTLYVVARNGGGEVAGTARLLPTTQPYLLSEIFPNLLHGQPVPASSDIWELSRFAAVDFDAQRSSPIGQFSSPVAVALLRATLHAAAQRGARWLITVSPLGVERLLRRAGFQAHRAGPPLIVDGQPIFACWIKVEADHHAEQIILKPGRNSQ